MQLQNNYVFSEPIYLTMTKQSSRITSSKGKFTVDEKRKHLYIDKVSGSVISEFNSEFIIGVSY